MHAYTDRAEFSATTLRRHGPTGYNEGCFPARRKLGLTQAELARRAGIRAETLNRIEQGKHSPTLRTMQKIDRALKRAVNDERER